jgi:2-polyprenyl-3-methyl-5-hydroxy-6-metoxy-1,4-benzoquinol methylase
MELNEKRAAYTTVRSDVCQLVPENATRILDVGCSNGALGSALMAMKPGRSVDGIEHDAALTEEARRVLTNVTHADLETFSWSDPPQRAYDCIIFADVLEHLRDPERHLTGARRCLAAGGSVIVSFPNIRHVTALRSIYLHGTFPRRDRGLFDRTHLRWFTLRDMREAIERCGYRIDVVDGSLRMRDRGGGLLNRIGDRVLNPVRRLYPVREFLTYQYCVRATTP